ncbi:hypothetical protein BC332_07604 [Capsicum chinense]|nr:hypothetical protein BC332_07604 [Capsicum chinense]
MYRSFFLSLYCSTSLRTSGFIEKVKDFIEDIGEKIEGKVGHGKPTADVSAVHIPHINLKKAEIIADVLVKNPNPIPIPLIDINYLIESDGRKLMSGLIPDAGTIHANDLIVDIPVFGRPTLSLEKKGEILVPHKPDIDLEKIYFKKFSFEETIDVLKLRLENKNDFDLALNGLDYDVWLFDVNIGGAVLEKSAKIGKNRISYLDLPITFRPKDFGSALWDMLFVRGTGYTMKGHVNVETLFGAMNLPISKEGGTTHLKKKKVDQGDDDDDDKVC